MPLGDTAQIFAQNRSWGLGARAVRAAPLQQNSTAGDVYSGHFAFGLPQPKAWQMAARSGMAAGSLEAWQQHERPDGVCSHCVVIWCQDRL